MAIDLDDLVPTLYWPAGVTSRTLLKGQDDRAYHEAIEDAFRDVWGRPHGAHEPFAAMLDAEGFDAGH